MAILLLVYAGAVALATLGARRWVVTLSFRAGLGLALLPMLLTGRAMVKGAYYGPLETAYSAPPLLARYERLPPADYYRILSDVQILNVPWAKAVRESVKHGRLPLLNRFMMSGDTLLGVFQPMAFHPSTVFGFLLPLATAWTFGGAFSLFLTAICAFLFFRDLELSEPVSLFGAAAWMLSNFIVFWIGWDVAPAFAPFPLLLLGLRRLARVRPSGVAITTAALVLALLAGHPESVLHEVAAGGLFFSIDLALSPGHRWASIGRALMAGILALGLSAPALLPFLEALPQSFETQSRRVVFAYEPKSVPFPGAVSSALLAVDADREGPHWRGLPAPSPRANDGIVAGIGALALAIASMAVFSRRREKWGLFGVGFLALAVAVGTPGIADAIGKLPLFDIALNGRLAGVAAFCLAALAALGLERLIEQFGAREATALFASMAIIAALFASAPYQEELARRVLLGIVPVVLLAVFARFFRASPARCEAIALGLFLTCRTADLPPLYPEFDARLFYPAVPELSRLPATPEPYRVVGLELTLPANQAAMYELEDPRGYTSMTNTRYLHLYPLWCIPQAVWFNRVDDPNRPFLSFLNVRYAIGHPGEPVPAGWRELVRGPDCSVFENPRALPRAFAPERIRFHGPREDPLPEMLAATDFGKMAWIDDGVSAGKEIANGRARVSTRREGIDLFLDVDAAAPAWIVVSQTFWRGWKAEIDGTAAPLHYANLAFVGVRVSAGRHRIALRYRPMSVEVGFLAFALTVVGIAIVRLRRPKSVTS